MSTPQESTPGDKSSRRRQAGFIPRCDPADDAAPDANSEGVGDWLLPDAIENVAKEIAKLINDVRSGQRINITINLGKKT